LAVLQVVLLTSSLLAPMPVMAQDAEADVAASPAEVPSAAEEAQEPAAEAPAAEPDPATEALTEEPAPEPEPQAAPAQELAPEPPAQEVRAEEPKADKEQKPDKSDQAPTAEPDPANEAPAEEPAPDVEPQAAPAQEPAPEPQAQEVRAEEPKAGREQKADRSDQEPTEPKAEQAPVEPAPEVAPVEPERMLVIDSQPRKLDLVVADTAKLSAWLCPVGDAPFGPDKEPATADDACAPAEDAVWSVDPAGVASFSKDEAAKVRLTADAPVDEATIIAKLGDSKANAGFSITAAPESKAEEPKAEEPKAEEPKAEEPKADEPKAEEPKAGSQSMSEAGPETARGEVADDGAPDTEAATAVAGTIQPLLIEPAAAGGTWSVTDATKDPEGTGTNGTLTFTVGFSRTSNGEASATVSTLNGTATGGSSCAASGVDYISKSAAFTTPTGNSGLTASFDVTICGDSLAELNETFSVVVTPSPSTNVRNGTGTIIDDDVATSADLSITKGDSPDPVTAGGLLTYTLVVSNAGPSDASGVSLSDTLPAGTTFVSLASPGGFSCTTPAVGASGTVSCSTSSLGSAGSGTFTLVVQVDPATAAGTITNTATVSGSTTDPDTSNNSATATTTVAPSADLSITKSDGITTVTAGDGVTHTFTITVTNNGPSDATSVEVNDTWPAGYTLGTITPASPTCKVSPTPLPVTIRCELGTIASGASKVVTIAYTVPASTPAGTQTNEALVLSSGVTDPNGTNNSASDTNTVATSADLSITKGDSPDPVTAGTDLTYTITVRNDGPSDAQSVSLADILPAGLSGATYCTGAACDPATGSAWSSPLSLGTLPAGQSTTVKVRAQVDPATAAGTITNTATVSGSTTDPDTSNNSATATTTVAPSADLSITKSDGITTVTAGDGVTHTFTITVTNNGPSDATSVELNDTWPAGYTRGAITITPPGGSCADVGGGPSFGCALGTLAPGQSKVITVAYTVPAATIGSVTNTATVSGSAADPTPGNNSASDTNTVATSADLSITKGDSPDPVTAGTDLTYTITVRNDGPSDAQSVSLADTLPAGLSGARFCVDPGPCDPDSPPGGSWTGSADLGTLAAGAAKNVRIRAQVDPATAAGTVLSNTATGSSATTDPNPANDTSTTTTSVATSADLSVTKTVGPAETLSGGTVSYSITVANGGPSSAANATLSDTFPATLQNVSVVDDGPYTCGAIVGNALTCNIASHPVGVDATITVTATVAPGTYADLTSVTNMATVSALTPDPDPADNSSSATFRIRGSAAITVTKTATPTSVPEPGGDVSFAVRITNTGSIGVSLTSLLDSVHGDLNGKGTCAVPKSLDPGATYDCSFSVFVGGNAGRTETDVVTARARATDGREVSASDDATVTVTNVLPAIAVTKTASVSELAEPGGDVTYSVTIRNLVGEALTMVAITDDKVGDLDDAGNAKAKDNSCVGSVGDTIAAGATLECQFTARVTGQAGDRHVNTITVTVGDDDESPRPADEADGVVPTAVTVVSATARAVVRIVADESAGQDDGGGAGGGGQPPTDMLLPTDSVSAAGGPLEDPMNWILWVLLITSVILSAGLVIRRVRYAESHR
jgi:uncharacterized repeat protein (TIGR01451 family)